MTDGVRDLRLITFRVGPETFVLDIMAVRQIIPYAGSTSVPTAPDFVEGIIVLRNEVIPIIDLRDRLYPQDRKSTRLNSSHSQISYAVFCLKKKKSREIAYCGGKIAS